MNRNSFLKQSLSGALAFLGVKSASAEPIRPKWIWKERQTKSGIYYCGSFDGRQEHIFGDSVHELGFTFIPKEGNVFIQITFPDGDSPGRCIYFSNTKLHDKSPDEVKAFLEQMYLRHSSI